MPTLYMLIGVPCAGKSTWVGNQMFDWTITEMVSTDAIIDRRAAAQGKTYSDVFKREIKSATAEMNQTLRSAISSNKDIVWDQTNVTAKARKNKLDQIPNGYRKVAIFVATPDRAELQRRLDGRPGKTIPYNIVMGMVSQLERPSTDEGFDDVIDA
jgi:hypothetical protein